MTADNALVLVILTTAVVLFISDRFRVDVVALMVLAALIVTQLVTPQQAFSGFASPAVITVWAVFIISGAMFHTGVADILAAQMLKVGGQSYTRLLLLVMLTVGLMSAFMNNVGAVAILLPAVVSMSRRLKIAPSKLLMPLAFAALLGGNLTLIGTPPNILAADILRANANVPSFTFFDFLPMGAVVLTAGILYMMLFGRFLLPERHPEPELIDNYPVRTAVAERQLNADSPLIGQTVAQTRIGADYDVNVLRVRHNNTEIAAPTSDRPLAAGDNLLLEGSQSDLDGLSAKLSLTAVVDWQASDWHPETDANSTPLTLVEITLAPASAEAGKTLREMDFRARTSLTVLAVRHDGQDRTDHLGDLPIQVGDSLLVQGTADKVAMLRRNRDFLVLNEPALAETEAKRTRKAPLALLILLGVILTITAGWFSAAPAMFIGALLMVLSGALTMEEAYESIDWQSIFLIAGMLPLGIAMEETGTAQLLADQLILLMGDWGVVAVLAGVFILTAVLTEVISNAAATVLMVPISIDAALGLSVDPRPFVMATVIAASTSFLMPIGHQVNVIIYGPGGYKFSDYARVGAGLNILILILVITVLPLIWPF